MKFDQADNCQFLFTAMGAIDFRTEFSAEINSILNGKI